MKRIFIAWFFISITLIGQIYSNPKLLKQREFQFSTHGICFAIDDLEYDYCREITGQLKIMIEQKTSPIVVSISAFKLALTCLSNYNPAEWINRKINDYFYLLVPRIYLDKLIMPPADARVYSAREIALGLKIDHLTAISDTDMKSTDFHTKTNPKKPKSIKPYYGLGQEGHIAISDRFVEALGLETNKSPLFITNREYFIAGASEYLPKWAVYIIGHGQAYETVAQKIADLKNEFEQYKNNTGIQAEIRKEIDQVNINQRIFKEGIIANLEITDVQKLLNFFATKITVRLVFIHTCYGAGINLKKALGNNNQSLAPALPFTLASGVITSAPIKMFLKNNNPYNFNNFFATLTKAPPIDFEQALGDIYSFYDEQYDGYKITTLANIPTIKFAGREWIEVLDLPNKVVSIGHVMARTRTEKLNLNKYFAGRRTSRLSPEERKKIGLLPEKIHKLIYPDALLIYPPNIPFTINIQPDPGSIDTPFPTIISMIPGRAIHELQKIEAPEYTLSQILTAFAKVGNLREHKIFLIRTLKVKNDLIDKLGGTVNEPLILKNALFMNKPGKTKRDTTIQELYFKHGDSDWKVLNVNTDNLEADLNRQAVTDRIKKLDIEIKAEQKIDPQSLFAVNLNNLKKELTKQHIIKAKRFKEEQKQITLLKNLAQSLANIVQTEPKKAHKKQMSR